jgi:hypothetical protein
MSLKLNTKNSGGGKFLPHPATDTLVKGVIVDVTEPEKRQTAFGEKEQFRVVIESEVLRPDGERFHVWTKNFTPSLNEKASFRKFLKQAFGRDVAETDADANGDLDVDSLLIGHPVQMLIVHEESNGETYANLSALTPDKSEDPLTPSGKYVRKKDRPAKDGNAASYKKAATGGGEESARENWQTVKVHVGKNAGVQLGDLDGEAVTKLLENWLPKAEANPKPTADDKRLIAALNEAKGLLESATNF